MDYTGVIDGAPGRICTDTEPGLSRLPLLLGYGSEREGPHGRICTRTDSALNGVPLLLGYMGKRVVLPAGISPATSAFEARRAIYCATGALKNGAPGRFRPVCLLSVSEAIYY